MACLCSFALMNVHILGLEQIPWKSGYPSLKEVSVSVLDTKRYLIFYVGVMRMLISVNYHVHATHFSGVWKEIHSCKRHTSPVWEFFIEPVIRVWTSYKVLYVRVYTSSEHVAHATGTRSISVATHSLLFTPVHSFIATCSWCLSYAFTFSYMRLWFHCHTFKNR